MLSLHGKGKTIRFSKIKNIFQRSSKKLGFAFFQKVSEEVQVAKNPKKDFCVLQVDALHHELRARGFSCWYDNRMSGQLFSFSQFGGSASRRIWLFIKCRTVVKAK